MGEVRPNTATVLVGDVFDQLATLDDGSVDCVVTSPPYWGLRDYGTGEWDGGDPECDHLGEPFRTKSKLNENWGAGFADVKNAEDREPFKATCGKCGAARIDRQIGLEPTPDEYLARMVAVFREVRRVLAPHGTCWVNLGDSYASGNREGHGTRVGYKQQTNRGMDGQNDPPRPRDPDWLKPKDLCGVPWRVALALQADGWYLRADIIWAKPNPMPESVTDRPTKSHEYVFLLTKAPRYFFDQEAVREPHSEPLRGKGETEKNNWSVDGNRGSHETVRLYNPAGRNIRTVWSIPTYAYPEAHFATYPPALVERCVKAGCPRRVCRTCGKPQERIFEQELTNVQATNNSNPLSPHGLESNRTHPRASVVTKTLGFTDCGHNNYRPGIVLDPFLGSGTTSVVALRQGMDTIGIELNPEYAALAEKRLARWWEEPARTKDVPDDQLVLV